MKLIEIMKRVLAVIIFVLGIPFVVIGFIWYFVQIFIQLGIDFAYDICN